MSVPNRGTEVGDAGEFVGFSCARSSHLVSPSYRNFLMSCAALMGQDMQPLYFPLLNSPMPPGVRNLQRWIESAWAHGYDEEGAQQLKHKLIGTEKWIGTAGE